ncbi:MAG: hypothetical protein K5917_05920 [Clostridiales bacterium]|nr:hypothetical protein [Clostridiales bacterium]
MNDKKFSLKLDDISKKEIIIRGIITRNPVLVQAIGLCPLIAVVTSAFAGLIIGAISFLILFVSEILACLFLKKTTRWVRVGIYALIGVAMIIPFNYLIDRFMPNTSILLGIYVPLLCVNSLSLFRCEFFATKTTKIKNVFVDALASGLGYLFVLLIVGFIREAFGNSTVFGIYVDFLPRANGMLMPFAGFIIIGFLSALLNWIIKRTKLESMSEVTLAKRIKNDDSITLQPDVPLKKARRKTKKSENKAKEEVPQVEDTEMILVQANSPETKENLYEEVQIGADAPQEPENQEAEAVSDEQTEKNNADKEGEN